MTVHSKLWTLWWNKLTDSLFQIPSARPQSRGPQSKGKKAARGVPSKFASGGYTQTHGVISSSDLAMLKENRW